MSATGFASHGMMARHGISHAVCKVMNADDTPRFRIEYTGWIKAASHGIAWHGMTSHGMAWHRMAWHSAAAAARRT